MPSNVSIEFAKAQKKYNEANNREEKLIALHEMKSTAPSHKGGENLRAEINRKISALKSQMEREKTRAKKGSAHSVYVKKEGIGQVAIVGTPNSGKSWLLNRLVGKKVTEETPYPFATKVPVPAMMDYEGGKIQLVEVPAVIEGSSNGKAQGKELLSIIRNADALILVSSSKKEKEILVNELFQAHIIINRERPKIIVKNSEFRGIQLSGKNYLKFPHEQLEGYLKNIGCANSSIIISGQINSLEDVSEALDEKIVYKRALVVDPHRLSEAGLSDLRDQIFLLLDKVLIYTKKPGKEADMGEPIALKKGSTIFDLAKELHKDFAKQLKFAKVWGSSKFPGQRVGPEYNLKHRDIVEIAV